MFARRLVAAAVLAAAVLAAAAPAADPVLADGKHLVAVTRSPFNEERLALLDVKGAEVRVLDGGPAKAELTHWKAADGLVTADVTTARDKYKFEGKPDAAGKRVLGTLSNERVTYRAVIVPSELKELTADNRLGTPAGLSDDLKELDKLRSAPNAMIPAIEGEKDAGKRKGLTAKHREAVAKAQAEAPTLLRKVVEAAGADAGVLYFAAPDLLAQATAAHATADEVKGWADKAAAAAAAHGPKAEAHLAAQVAAALTAQDAYAALALPSAEKWAADTAKAPPAVRVRALRALVAAQTRAGHADAAKLTLAAVDKLETELDAEHKKAGIGFAPANYRGREDNGANRVAVLELFTGAFCPPCVAADLAFDGLEGAYTPKDLVLLQYHQHVPAPDPLTNPDTLARQKYYAKLFPNDMGGVPSSVIGGKPVGPAGGPREAAEKVFDTYRKRVDSLLEERTDVTAGGTATLAGGTLTVAAAVGGKGADGATVRVVLAEEEVRYADGSGIRFHHQVVRSLFGKPDGWRVKDLKDGKATAEVKLDEVRKGLGDYLDGFVKDGGKFGNPDRPLKLERLKVVVLVQDDDTGEILQAVQLDVATAG